MAYKNIKKYVRAATRAGIPISNVVVETGTYQGDFSLRLAELFTTVHTIELSPKWHKFSSNRLAPVKNVVCHKGDSAEVLSRLIGSIHGPAVFFLDAHFAGGDTALGEDEVPVLRELQVICSRPYMDLIVIDDASFLGKTGHTGAEESLKYPPMVFDWRSVTVDDIANLANQNNRTHWVFEHNRIFIFRNLSLVRAALLKMMLFAS